jgi:hypothetical protein
MNRAFGFTNGLRRSLRGTDDNWEEGINETRSLKSWQVMETSHGGQQGRGGPPRDLTLRRASGGKQGNNWAGKGATGRAAQLAFASARGPPPGTGFKAITQDTSPEHGLFKLAANRLPTEAAHNVDTGDGASRNEGAQQPPGQYQPGPMSGTTGSSQQGAQPAPPATQATGGAAIQYGHRGHQAQGGQAAYSGIGRYLAELGPNINDTALLIRTLQWQRDVAGENTKATSFKAEVGSLQGFQAFLMMREGNAMVTLLHSVAKYFSISTATSRYQGRHIGFVGDRLPTREPGPVLLPASKGWDWVKKSVRNSIDGMAQTYSGGAHYGVLWSPTRDSTEVDLVVSRLLILPPLFVKLIRDAGKALMPHEVWALVQNYMDTHSLPDDCKDACSFVHDWCLVAGQSPAQDKDSHLAFGLDAVTEQDHDGSLAKWLDTRLDTTLGQCPHHPEQHGATGGMPQVQQGSSVTADVITQAVGQGLALGYQQLLPQRGAPAPAAAGGQAGRTTDTTSYSADDVCAVMAFSGIEDPVDCQVIWTIFSEKKKNIDACRRYLMKNMNEYAYDRRISINAGIYLEQEMMKAILDLRFNPGEGTAYVQSAAKGLSILCCRSRPNNETEKIKEREHALNATKNTRLFDEYLKYVKGATRQPAINFWDLKQNIATYMALLWVLFGDRCDYYLNIYKIHAIMDLAEVQQLRTKFTPEIVRRITWAIIDDGRSFFNTVLTQQDFDGRGVIVFPQSFLAGVLENICFCNPIQRGNFPAEWLWQPRTDRIMGSQGATSGASTAQSSPGGDGGNTGGTTGGGMRQHAEPGRRGSPSKRAYEGYGTGTQQGAGTGGGGGGQRWAPPSPDPCHPKIAALMNPYLAKQMVDSSCRRCSTWVISQSRTSQRWINFGTSARGVR